eukprot:gene18021-21511_t
MNAFQINKLQFTVKQSVAFAKLWAPTAAMWGAVAGSALLYAVQPRFLFRHLPIIGDNYLTQKDKEAMAKAAAQEE